MSTQTTIQRERAQLVARLEACAARSERLQEQLEAVEKEREGLGNAIEALDIALKALGPEAVRTKKARRADTSDAILSALRSGPASRPGLETAIGGTGSQVANGLQRLLAKGAIIRLSRGRYALPGVEVVA